MYFIRAMWSTRRLLSKQSAQNFDDEIVLFSVMLVPDMNRLIWVCAHFGLSIVIAIQFNFEIVTHNHHQNGCDYWCR